MKTLFNSLLLPFNFKLWSCLLILTFNHSVLTIAQNLVPNPSFEDYTTCPNDWCMLPNNWYTCSGNPDYFNACDITNTFSVPENYFGYQNASDGNGYCGFYSLSFTTTPPYREYLGCQLINPLIIGQKYYVSFKVNFSGGGGIGMVTNNIGLLFSTVSFQDSDPYDSIWGTPITNFAHVNNTSIISDSLNWTTISGTLIADSAYQYILIGNFFDVQHTDTTIINSIYLAKAYYFIDEVCVSTDSATCFTNTSLKEEFDNSTNITVSPNPVIDHSQITIKESDEQTIIKLYNAQGKDITNSISIEKVNSSSFVLKRNKLPSGIYFIRIKTNNNLYNSKLIFF